MVAGLLWIPHHSVFEAWLEPVIVPHATAAHGEATAGLEGTLMLWSVVAAALGIGLAYLMYYRRTLSAEFFSRLAGGVPYRILLEKYYVDELYQAVFVRGTLALAAAAAWFDLHVIDGIVNGTATVTRGVAWVIGLWDLYVVDGAVNVLADGTYAVGRRIRNVQTGAINAYLYVIVVGVLGGVLLYWSWASAS